MQDELKRIIRNTFLFDGVSEDQCGNILSAMTATLRSYKNRETICSRENLTRGFYIIKSGEAIVTALSGDGKAPAATLRILREGNVFGAASLFADEDEDYTSAIRSKGQSEVIMIPRDDIEKAISENATVAKNYIRFISDRIRFLNKRIISFTAGSAEQKLACYLLEAPLNDDGSCILPMMSHLALSLNLGRASLYRALNMLEESKIIKRGEDGEIYILSREALKKLL